MKKIFRNIFLFAASFFIHKKSIAENENSLINKARQIQYEIFSEHHSNNKKDNRFISYIDENHDLDKIEGELSERIEGANWWNWWNWDTWDTWNNWFTWDTWDNWWNWDNWGNWFNWTNV